MKWFLLGLLNLICLAGASYAEEQPECAKVLEVAPLVRPVSRFDNPVKTALRNGQVVFGGFLVAPSPENAERIATRSHFVWIDTEHGIFSPESVMNVISRFHLTTPAVPIIRVPTWDHTGIKPLLSTGTLGVVVPEVKTAENVKEFIKRVKYPPFGERGFGPAHSTGYLDPVISKEAIEKANDQLLVIVMIETPEAVENIEAIAAVPGIDVLYVGPYDLRVKMGNLEPSDPAFLEAVAKVEAVAHKNKIPLGIPANTGEIALEKRRQGYQFITMASDQEMLRQSVDRFVQAISK